MRHAWSPECGQVAWHHAEPYEERQGDQGSPGDAHVLHGSVALLHFLLDTSSSLLSDEPERLPSFTPWHEFGKRGKVVFAFVCDNKSKVQHAFDCKTACTFLSSLGNCGGFDVCCKYRSSK